MKLVIMLKNGHVDRLYSDGAAQVEAVELDPATHEEAVKLPNGGWTDVSLCDIDVVGNRAFVRHVFDDDRRQAELERWQESREKRARARKRAR